MSIFKELKERIEKTKKAVGLAATEAKEQIEKTKKESVLAATVTVAMAVAPTDSAAQGFKLEPVNQVPTTQTTQTPQRSQSGRTITFEEAQQMQTSGQTSEELAFLNSLPPYTRNQIQEYDYQLAPMELQVGLEKTLYGAVVCSRADPGKVFAIPVAEGYYRGNSTRLTPIRRTNAVSINEALKQQERKTGMYKEVDPNIVRNARSAAYNRTINRVNRVLNDVNRGTNTIRKGRNTVRRAEREIRNIFGGR